MRASDRRLACGGCRVLTAVGLLAIIALATQVATAQNNNNFNNGYRSVGGVSVRADGLLDQTTTDEQGRLAKLRVEAMKSLPADINQAVPLRSVSLKGLEAAIAAAHKAGEHLTPEMHTLGGLQQIRYVLAYPEQKDIILVGPAEGCKVDARGCVVGVTTGRPVMLLDDLLVALRSAIPSAQTGITCSIDPTAEGMQQLRAHAATLRTMQDPKTTAAGIEKALGRQQISVIGVPATSHFAAVLVAADYRMKRIAMNFEPTPVRSMTSFLKLLPAGGRGMANVMQRWWLEPKYDAVVRDPQGLAWELSGASVRCLTEEEFNANGERKGSGKANPLAQRWADSMTKHYDELAVAEPVFGQLRNCMEIALVATLIHRERLTEKTGCSLALLMDEKELPSVLLPAPTQVDSKVSMLRKGSNWIISASGGVAIYPSLALQQPKQSDAPAAIRAKIQPKADGGKWYWN